MERKGAQHHDRVIEALASRQHGVVARFQLIRLGISASAIEARVRRGSLLPLWRGVYAVGHAAVGTSGRRIAAVLTIGEGAYMSHRSATAAWGIRAFDGTRFDVSVASRAGRRARQGIAVHRMALEPFETTVLDALPVTTPARTLLDLAEIVGTHDLERAVARADGLRLFDLTAVERVMEAHPARAGSRRLARLLASQALGDGLTRSELEERVLALCARMGVQRPLVNAMVAGLEVDFYWPASGLVVEADSRRHHLTPIAFERDRERDAILLRHGLRVLRLTHARIVREPDAVGADLLALTSPGRLFVPGERKRAQR
jgi:very-short-patch-repair endonuclease